MPRPKKVPSDRRHKPTGQAVVTIEQHDFYLGPYGSRKSHRQYQRLIRRWLATGHAPKAQEMELSLDDLIARYWIHAESYYQRNGEPTGELANIRYALRPVHELFGDTPAKNFGPRDLKTVMHTMIEQGLCRNLINRRLCKVKRVFKWAASEDLLPVRVYQGLATVEGLKKFRTTARETEPVRPVSDADFEATLPHLPKVVRDMANIQRWTGCRPGEVCALRPQDVDRSQQPWVYRLPRHKTEHLDQQRTILIGPRAQAILGPYLERPADAYCFSPAESEWQRKTERRARRKSPVQPSQRDRSKKHPRRTPGLRYTRQAYLHSIRRGCQQAGVDLWSPNRLRHAAATKLRNEFELEIAQTVLGHRRLDTTLIYAQRRADSAKKAILAVG